MCMLQDPEYKDASALASTVASAVSSFAFRIYDDSMRGILRPYDAVRETLLRFAVSFLQLYIEREVSHKRGSAFSLP